MNKPQNIIVHHSATPKDIPAFLAEKSFETTHKANKYPLSKLGWHIGYHYVCYGTGELRQYRQEDEPGAHTKQQGMNYKSLGICLSGNFNVELPNPEQIATLTKLLKEKIAEYKIKPENIYPHRHFANKSCYGTNLTDDWARNLIFNKTTMKVFKTEADPTVYLPLGEFHLLPVSSDWETLQAAIPNLELKVVTPEQLSLFTMVQGLVAAKNE